MDSEDRDQDKSRSFAPAYETGKSKQLVSYDVIKSVYICEGISAKEISERYHLPVENIERFIQEHRLEELRAAYIKEGLMELQNVQLNQAQKLMQIESSFKKMRILQLEKMLQDFMTYYARHGDFYKRHQITGEILKDINDLPMQIKIPNVTNEIRDLKESVSLSEGLKMLLGQIDAIINKPKQLESIGSDIIDVTDYDNLFKKKRSDD